MQLKIFFVEKNMRQFIICIRDQNLALSLHDWWVSTRTGTNRNSNYNNAYQRESWWNINQFPLLSIALNCYTIAEYLNTHTHTHTHTHTKSYALLKYNPKQYKRTEEILMLTIHEEIHSITNFWKSMFVQGTNYPFVSHK